MRFARNKNTMTIWEQDILWNSCVIVCGLGGGGGVLAELLIRSGLGNIVLVDGDIYEESNLNRQLGCTESSIGKYKVDVMKERLLSINRNINISTYNEFISINNYDKIINKTLDKFQNVVLSDTVDSYVNKKKLCDICKKLHLVYITGGVGFFSGWVAKIKDLTLDDFLTKEADQNVVFPSPAAVWTQSSIQAQNVINLVLKRDWNIDDKIISFNLMNYQMIVSDPRDLKSES